MLTIVLIVLILELTLQLVTNVHMDSLMITYMLIVKVVKLNIINVNIVTKMNVIFVMSTEIYLTVLVLLDMLKLMENVNHVPITALLVLVPHQTVLPVSNQESMPMFVTVLMDYMMMVPKIHNVKFVTIDVLGVMDLISTVLFVPLLEKEFQNVSAKLV
jgi:hypothetical protein